MARGARGEHLAPGIYGRKMAGGKSARESVFPQDQYVLAGLNDALWVRSDEEPDLTVDTTAAKDGQADGH